MVFIRYLLGIYSNKAHNVTFLTLTMTNFCGFSRSVKLTRYALAQIKELIAILKRINATQL